MANVTTAQPRFHDMSLGAQLLIWATRHWMRACRQRRMISACVPRSFAEAGLLNAYAALCEILAALSFREYPPCCFARTNSPQLSDAEIELMDFLLFVDRNDREANGDEAAALRLLPDRITPAVGRHVLALSKQMLRNLQAHGHRLVVPRFVVESPRRAPVSPNVSRQLEFCQLH